MAYVLEQQDNRYGQKNELSEEMQERILRLNALCRVYESTDRVLTGDPVKVIVVDDGPAPAWSDGQSVWINAGRIDEVDLETLTQVTGLNYHELAHHLYSPRRATDVVKFVLDKGYENSFNILEDQRIETLLCGRYPSVIPYLTATMVRYMIDSPEDMAANYVAVRGRRYLPVQLRGLLRDAFIEPKLIPAIIEIVDEYRILAFPRDYVRAQELIERFHLEVLSHLPIDPPAGAGGCTNRSPVSKGRPEPGKMQERDATRGAGQGDAEPDYEVPKMASEPGEDEGEGEGQGDGDDESATNKSAGTGTSNSQQQPGEFTEEQQSTPASGEHKKLTFGKGHIPSEAAASVPRDLHDSVTDILHDTLDQVHERKDVKQDARAKQRIIIGGDGKNSELMKRGKYQTDAVPMDVVAGARRFAEQLQRLRDSCEPAWERETSSGRLNVQRVITGCELDQAFDRWDEGTDGADVEAVILVDRSGSMSSDRNDVKASHAVWTIKRALSQIEAPVTVYAFDDQTELAYSRDEAVHKTEFKYIFGNGGTDPYEALLAAERVLTASRRTNKILFLITDGAFNSDKNNEVISRLNKRGVLTSMALIIDPQYVESAQEQSRQWRASNPNGVNDPYDLGHGVNIFTSVRRASDLVPFAKAVVDGAIRRRMG